LICNGLHTVTYQKIELFWNWQGFSEILLGKIYLSLISTNLTWNTAVNMKQNTRKIISDSLTVKSFEVIKFYMQSNGTNC
jgi:hypothetical protein